jgi:hypothetical protein
MTGSSSGTPAGMPVAPAVAGAPGRTDPAMSDFEERKA